MAGRKLALWPDPVLRMKALPVKVKSLPDLGLVTVDVYDPNKVDWGFIDDLGIPELVADMWKIMRDEDGIGLAANQAQVAKRIIIMEIPNSDLGPMVLINPEIIHISDDLSEFAEGCLSFPEQRVNVKRPADVTVRYVSVSGQYKTIKLSGLAATCVQHEIDHLNGKVIIDHTSYLNRSIVEKSLKKILAGKAS